MVKVVCPECGGAKSSYAVSCSDRGCETGVRACEFCKGEGQVSSDAGERWRAGKAKHAGVLEDYADVANGLYELHVATGELGWLEESRRLALVGVELFRDDERGGFFLTPSDGEQLVVRKKDFDDHPTFLFWLRDGKLARYEGHIDPVAIEEATARSLPDPS